MWPSVGRTVHFVSKALNLGLGESEGECLAATVTAVRADGIILATFPPGEHHLRPQWAASEPDPTFKPGSWHWPLATGINDDGTCKAKVTP